MSDEKRKKTLINDHETCMYLLFLEIGSHAIWLAGNCGQIVKIINLSRLPREAAPCRIVNSYVSWASWS
jgi:hypothetical protein